MAGSGELRDLDHMVVSTDAQGELANMWVNRAWDLSDHWPICSFPKRKSEPPSGEVRTQNGSGVRLKREAMMKSAHDIAFHNMWKALEVEGDPETEEGSARFLDTSMEVAMNVKVAEASIPTGRALQKDRPRLSRESRRAIESRRRVFRRWDEAENSEEKGALWARYLDLKREVKKLTRADKKVQWGNFIAEGASALTNGEWHKAWK